MLQADGLTKRYGGLLALNRVSLELQSGEIVGTWERMAPARARPSTWSGVFEPSAGDLSLCGIHTSNDPIAYKRRIGYVPEEPAVYAHLTASDYLMLVGRLRRLPARTLRLASGAVEAAATARQPLPHDDDVLEGHAPARARCVRAPAQPGAARARRAVLRARRQCRTAAADPAAASSRARGG